MTGPQDLRRDGRPTLRYELHRPTGLVKGAVLLTHGYAEHSGRYGEVVAALVARGLLTATWDLRGHGHSEGIRGYVERFSEYPGDANDLLVELARDEAWKAAGPVVLIGHSLGGLITFHVGLDDPGRFRGAILSSPFFGLALAVPAPKRLAAKLMSRVVPAFALPSGLKGADLTHDAALATAYDNDPLLVKKVPSRWFTEVTAAHQVALERAPSWRIPLLIMAGGDDRVASVPAARALFERVGASDKEFRPLEGQFHEIFNEVERPRFIAMAADRAAALCAG
jgi:alpha-beta hydrolase superfamily lysophospholipase